MSQPDQLPLYLPWHPDNAGDRRTRITDPHRSVSGIEFATMVDSVAGQFSDSGVGEGETIGVFLPNRLELLVALTAAWRLGAAVTPINSTFTADESAHQVSDSGAMLVVATDEAAADDPGARFPGAAVLAVSDLRLDDPRDVDRARPDFSREAIALLLYTSGSTGRPKGVMLDHSNIIAMTTAMGQVISLDEDSHVLMALPLFHANALMVSFLSPFANGGRLTIQERFHPDEFARAVTELRPTYFSAVPAIFSYLLALPESAGYDFSSLDFAICGAAPASVELFEAFRERFGVRLLTGYGLTEGTCASTFVSKRDELRPGTVGRALPGQEVRISDGAGGVAGTGVEGEVLIRGEVVMRGYLNRPETNAETIVDGWLHTGDIGRLDEDGYLYLVDRLKDIIIRGGENLYPSEIEATLTSHAGVREAAVVGAPHHVLGEVPVAFVTSTGTDGADGLVDELDELVRTKLAKVKWPELIHVVDDLKRNPVGKIDKPGMRRELRA